MLRLLLWGPLALASAWDYSENGEDWAREGVGLCAGAPGDSNQSPIDLSFTSVEPTDMRKLFLKYPAFEHTMSLYNNGHALAMTLPEVYRGGFGFVPSSSDLQQPSEAVYRAWQLSLHAPSEHTFAGRRLPLELQIVHQRVSGPSDLAVVSVLFEDDAAAPSPFLDALLSGGLPSEPWEDRDVNFVRRGLGSASDDHLGLQPLLAGSTFFAYEGSLTTPPCETGVRHFVRMKPRTASAQQLQQLSEVLKSVTGTLGNYRRAPNNSTAGNVVVVGAVDTISGDEVVADSAKDYAQDATAIKGSAAGMARATIAQNPELGTIGYGDSEALVAAKEDFKQAELSQAAATQARDDKTLTLNQAEVLFHQAQGSVLRIQLKMKIAGAQTALTTASDSLRVAIEAADKAALKLVQVWRADKAGGSDPSGIAQTKTTSASPTEFGSAQVATTAMPYVEGQAWGSPTPAPEKLVYPGPAVVLPHGPSASPFVADGAAETEVAIGAANSVGLDSDGKLRLAPNLRQLDGPEGSVPMPYRPGSGGAAAAALLDLSGGGTAAGPARAGASLRAHGGPGRQRRLAP